MQSETVEYGGSIFRGMTNRIFTVEVFLKRRTAHRILRGPLGFSDLKPVWIACLFVMAQACAPIGPTSGGAGSPEPVSSEDDRVIEAREALATDDASTAVALLTEVLGERSLNYSPDEVDVLLARAYLDLLSPTQAIETADGIVAAVGANNSVGAEAAIIAAEAWFQLGDSDEALSRILTIRSGASPSDIARALSVTEPYLESLDTNLLLSADSESLVVPELLVAAAESELALGSLSRARTMASEAVSRGASGDLLNRAEAVVARGGEVVSLGVLLSQQGSPGQRAISEQVLEGVQVAIAEFTREMGTEVELEVLDDRGMPRIATQSMQSLVARGVAGVVGPIQDRTLAAAATGRAIPVPIVSPTATGVGVESPRGVYSVRGVDPSAASLIADQVLVMGYRRIVVFHPGTYESNFQTEAFSSALSAGGRGVLAEVRYDSLATFFRDPVREMLSFNPDAVLLPLGARDVELVAPQLTFFGVDTLDIQLFGTEGWTSPAVLENVDPRHTNGVISAAPAISEEGSGSERFTAEYERLFQRSLRSDLPAYGYDAAWILLSAAARSGATPQGVLDWLDSGTGAFPGATGYMHPRSGRLERDYEVGVLWEGSLVSWEEWLAIQEILVGGEG